MAVLPSPFGLQSHVRSISLPTRLNSSCTKVESELHKLKTRTCTSSKESIQTGLMGLAELYPLVEEIMQSPLTQQALAQHQNGAILEESLNDSIGLLDSCGALGDLISSMSQQVRELQSVLRRKGGDLSVANNVNAYINSRKRMNKDVNKCLRALKQIQGKVRSTIGLDLNHHLATVIRLLREVMTITISIFRSLLLFLSVGLAKAASGWSMITNLMMTKPGLYQGRNMIVNDVESADLAIYSLRGCIKKNDSNVDVQICLRKLEIVHGTVEGFEAGLDFLYRRLIQSRVSFLNVLAI